MHVSSVSSFFLLQLVTLDKSLKMQRIFQPIRKLPALRYIPTVPVTLQTGIVIIPQNTQYILVSAVKMYDSSFLILGSEVETGFNIVDNSGVCLYAER